MIYAISIQILFMLIYIYFLQYLYFWIGSFKDFSKIQKQKKIYQDSAMFYETIIVKDAEKQRIIFCFVTKIKIYNTDRNKK